MSGRPAIPPDGSVRPARAARPTGFRAELGAFVRTVGGLGRLVLVAGGFGLALVLLATTVLNNRQPDAGSDSRVVVPGVWAASDDSPPNKAAQRAAERDAELDRARRDADQASAESGMKDPTPGKKGRQGSPDDDHGPPVANPPEQRHKRSPEPTPTDSEPTEEPKAPAAGQGEETSQPPKPTESAEPTEGPDPAASKSPTESPKPDPSESTEPTSDPTLHEPTPSATPTPTPSPTSSSDPDDDDEECTIEILGLCL